MEDDAFILKPQTCRIKVDIINPQDLTVLYSNSVNVYGMQKKKYNGLEGNMQGATSIASAYTVFNVSPMEPVLD
jgi:hypothetical protein